MRQQKTNRIDTTLVQGEGSYIIAKALTWDEFQEIQAMDEQQIVKRAPSFITENVIEWNWTGDDDKPLPAPASDPLVIGKLTIREVVFLMRTIPQQGINPGN